MTVEGTPSYEPPPVETRDAWSVVLQERLARRAQAEAVETPAARAPPEAEFVPAPIFREPARTLEAPIKRTRGWSLTSVARGPASGEICALSLGKTCSQASFVMS